jgi:hypothetical protein
VSLKAKLSNLRHAEVEVRGERVTVRELTAGQRAELLPLFKDNPAKVFSLVCAMCAYDGDSLLFSRDEAESLPPDVVDAIAGEALKLSGMGDESPND